MKHSQYGVVNWFVRLALDGESIPVFGTGRILRDFVYVDDCVDAILAAAGCERAVGEVFNVGWDKPTSFLELAGTLVQLCPECTWHFARFTPERAAQEPGDFYSDITKIRTVVGWEPRTELEDGLRRTLEYYREHRGRYWTRPAPANRAPTKASRAA
jgi:UDP-glucose 4-epimerase